MSRGVYIHIPFCASKCGYCDFYSRTSNVETQEAYIRALCNQIRQYLQNGDKAIRSIYIGGGTPSVLGNGQLTVLFQALSGFALAKGGEITVECNPDSADEAFFSEIGQCGANRLSIGAQSLIDEELHKLGRRHNAGQVKKAFDLARHAGFDNISIDLMLAIPGQTNNSLIKSLQETVKLDPEHISVYILKVEKNTLFEKKGVPQPDDDIAADLYLAAAAFLKSHGFEHYEISNFAKPGKQAVHNSSYWEGNEYIAFGCGAYGYLNGIRYHYQKDLQNYIQNNGLLEPQIDEALSPEAIFEEKRMLSLRTNRGISKKDLNSRQLRFFRQLAAQKLALETSQSFILTAKGFLVSNSIIAEMEYQQKIQITNLDNESDI